MNTTLTKPNAGNGIQDEFEFLLKEVRLLATRLKISSRTIHEQNSLPAGGKIILQNLANLGPQTVPQMARGCGSSRQNIQVLVNRLEIGGWLEFVDNPAHKISSLLQLTELGRELLNAAVTREAKFFATLLQHATEVEILAAGKLLFRLRSLLDQQRNPPSHRHRAVHRKQSLDTVKKRNERKPRENVTVESPIAIGIDDLPVNLL